MDLLRKSFECDNDENVFEVLSEKKKKERVCCKHFFSRKLIFY